MTHTPKERAAKIEDVVNKILTTEVQETQVAVALAVDHREDEEVLTVSENSFTAVTSSKSKSLLSTLLPAFEKANTPVVNNPTTDKSPEFIALQEIQRYLSDAPCGLDDNPLVW